MWAFLKNLQNQALSFNPGKVQWSKSVEYSPTKRHGWTSLEANFPFGKCPLWRGWLRRGFFQAPHFCPAPYSYTPISEKSLRVLEKKNGQRQDSNATQKQFRSIHPCVVLAKKRYGKDNGRGRNHRLGLQVTQPLFDCWDDLNSAACLWLRQPPLGSSLLWANQKPDPPLLDA